MSKFLKFIVNVFLVVAICVAAAILIPPLTGITTTIVDTASMDTNLPLGSITYSTDVAVSELQTGDEVLKENNSATYSYVIKSGDVSSGKFTVVSSTDPNGKEETISLRNTVSKVAVVVPYIGYVIIAMHSTEGIIIIALAVVLMIILFILSELWKSKGDEDEDEDEEPEEEPVETVAEVGAVGIEGSTTARMPVNEIMLDDDLPEINPGLAMEDQTTLMNEEPETSEETTGDASAAIRDLESESEVEAETADKPDLELAAEAAEAAAAEDTASAIAVEETDVPAAENAEPIAVEDVPAETEEADKSEPVEAVEPSEERDAAPAVETPAAEGDEAVSSIVIEQPEKSTEATQEFDLAEMIFAATEEVEAEEEKRAQEADNASSMDETQIILPIEPEEKEPEELPERFVPVERPTYDELIEQAKKAGDDPEIRKDNATDITIVDYSDIL